MILLMQTRERCWVHLMGKGTYRGVLVYLIRPGSRCDYECHVENSIYEFIIIGWV